MTGAAASAGAEARSRRDARYEALLRTAAALRAEARAADALDAEDTRSGRRPGVRRRTLVRGALVVTGAGAAVALVASGPARLAAADAGADSSLFSLTNQDRSSNGLRALQWHATLGAIGEAKPYGGCGFNVNGRSYDMIQRNYFAHPILNCGGQLVFNMMNADGIPYRSAGENIGWSSNSGDAAASAAYINTAFMNSPEHRANILNSSYTHMGVGSDFTGGPWTGAGSSLSNVWMFSEEFAQLATSAPPPPPPAPRPAPPPVRNAPAPTPPLPAPVATAPAATPVPTATPEATETPLPYVPPGPSLGVPPPLLLAPTGLLSDAVESVLEGLLVG